MWGQYAVKGAVLILKCIQTLLNKAHEEIDTVSYGWFRVLNASVYVRLSLLAGSETIDVFSSFVNLPSTFNNQFLLLQTIKGLILSCNYLHR